MDLLGLIYESIVHYIKYLDQDSLEILTSIDISNYHQILLEAIKIHQGKNEQERFYLFHFLDRLELQ